MTIFIAQHFKSRGKKVGILSRGYKRESKGTKLVTDGVEILNDFKHYGDEPYLMAKRLRIFLLLSIKIDSEVENI